MGKIVAVWSSDKKAGKSVMTYIMTNQVREIGRQNLKILVCCLNLQHSLLYKLFGFDVSDIGLQDLVNYNFFEYDKQEMFKTLIPKGNGISFLGTYRSTNSFAQKNADKFSQLFDKLRENFDLIIFDTVSGKENVLTNLVLQKADIILNLFVQDNESMKEIDSVEDSQETYNQEVIYVASKYRNIYPRLADIKRRYSLKNMYTMEYCETLQEMKNRDSLHLYLQRNTECNNSMKGISSRVLEAFDLLPKDHVKEKRGRYVRSLISSIFALFY